MFLSEVTRRQALKTLGIGLGATLIVTKSSTRADFVHKEDKTAGQLLDGSNANPCHLKSDGAIIRPERSLPTISQTDVLVVGGGPAGCCAAIAAARLGLKVTLVERYGHFGGLSTGGLVLTILGHWINENGKVIQSTQGIGEEMMKRLETLPNGISNRVHGQNPVIDPEAYKYLLVEMITEANIEVFLHSWASDAIILDEVDKQTGNPIVCGAVLQTKLGPQAILAKQVVDTTGDGDVLVPAGAAHTQRAYDIGLPYRLGNLDRTTAAKDSARPRHTGDVTPVSGVNWVNMAGPSLDGVDVKILSMLELKHRKQIWKQYQNVRSTPGYEKVFLLDTASQLGVRITRVIEGIETLTLAQMQAGKKYEDCVGIGGAWYADHIGWQIPYRALIPKNVENIITAGRSISAEPLASDLIRVIPNCWVSGQAAGVAAALAVQSGCTARSVSIPDLRKTLLSQDAYLG